MDEAITSIRAAIQENPSYGEAYNNLGVLYRDEGEIEQAIVCYDKCLEITPTSRNAAQNRLLAMNCILSSFFLRG
jgi:tetratricopeptide (TPR) repeat protein